MERIPHSIVFATSVDNLYNNHKRNFNGNDVGAGETRHTGYDWFLAPKERPSIEKAAVKEHYVEIPGRNGGLDLTESLTGFPLYELIEGEIEFVILNERILPILNTKGEVVNEKNISWEILDRDIRNFLNGKERYMMLEDDPSWYYVGRFSVGKYDSSDTANSHITIGYKLYPFKKLSTQINNVNDPFNIYFDSISLRNNDISDALVCFWNKTEMDFLPGDTKTFKGSVKGELACGAEPTNVSFYISRESEGFPITATFKDKTNTYQRDIEVDGESGFAKPRNFVLTNKTNKSILYSDNEITINVNYPNEFSQTVDYAKGDIVYVTSSQNYIKWILKAKANISKGNVINFSNWDIDGVMDCTEFSESETYKTGDLVYILNNNTLTLYRALNSVDAGQFDAEDWTDSLEDITTGELYSSVRISLLYDIGVM